jgi:hypothetical protein
MDSPKWTLHIENFEAKTQLQEVPTNICVCVCVCVCAGMCVKVSRPNIKKQTQKFE